MFRLTTLRVKTEKFDDNDRPTLFTNIKDRGSFIVWIELGREVEPQLPLRDLAGIECTVEYGQEHTYMRRMREGIYLRDTQFCPF